MPNQQDIKSLLEGKDAWDNRRLANPYRVPDLSQANISRLLLNNRCFTEAGKLDLRSYNLSGARFSGSVLNDIDMSGADLSFANFSNVWFNDGDLTGTTCTNTAFDEARLAKSKLIEAQLASAKFRNAYVVKADFTGAKCYLTDFTGANLSDSDFTEAQLRHAELNCADLSGTMLWKAKIGIPTKLKWDHCRVGFGKCEKIGDVADLLRYMAKLDGNYASKDTSEPALLYYRGESQKHPYLIPSVMRPDKCCKKKYPLRPSEADMLVALTARRPHDFARESTALGELVTAQHFRLPTRLLDITRNPLVALFHATAKKNQEDVSSGQLHILAVPKSMVKPYTSHSISVITNFTRLRRGEQNLLLTKTRKYTEREYDCSPSVSQTALRPSGYMSAMARLVQYIRLEHPSFEERIQPRDLFRVFVVEPQQSNERIMAQSAAFLVSAFHERFDECEVQGRTGDLPIYHQYTFEIPHGRKDCIRRQLRSLNITAATMYPGLEKAAEAVKNEYGGSGSSEKPTSNLE